MRIAYCVNVRLPSERAHGHQIAQVCDALDQLGHTVSIFAPYRKNAIRESYHAYYGAHPNVTFRSLGTFDPIDRWWLPGITDLWLLNLLLRRSYRKAIHPSDFDLAYTRSRALLPVLLATGIPTVLELHQLPRVGRGRFVSLAKRCRLVVCLTSSMRETLITWGIPAERVIAEGDAVDLRRFASLPSKEEARAAIPFSTDRLVVGYVGRLKTLGMEKGVKHLLEALHNLHADQTFMGLIVGGPAEDLEEYRRLASSLGLTEEDVRFTGEMSARKVPSMLVACDILAMPFPDLPHYRYNMSPLKMFEYMAAGRVIVTSDLPTVRDVLSEETAFFCKPGDSLDLARVLKEIAANPEVARRKAQAARELAEQYSWEKRMGRILARVS